MGQWFHGSFLLMFRADAKRARRVKNPNVGRPECFLACHERGDVASTPQSAAQLAKVRQKLVEDPSSENAPLNHDAVANVKGRDGHGHVLGFGSGVSKIVIRIYKDVELRIYKSKERERMEREPECLGGSSLVPRPTNSMNIQTGSCNLTDACGQIVALGEVIGAPEDSTLKKLNFLCMLDEIKVPSARVFEKNVMLSNHFVGQVIPWSAFFMTYLE